MIDIMVDVETLDNTPDAHILAIAAVPFNILTGAQIGQVFYRVTAEETNGKISAETVHWWMEQNEEARARNFAAGGESLMLILRDLNNWLALADPDGDARIWQRGGMDQVWLESAFKRNYMTPRATFRQWCDQRTITKLAPVMGIEASTPHCALDDCYKQIADLVVSLKKLGFRP